MSKKKVFVTRRIPQPGLDLLKDFDMTLNPEDRVLTRQELIAGSKGKDAVLCLLTDPIDGEIMDALPTVKIFANYAVGFNNIDVEAATKRKVAITNTPGVLTDTTADFAWTLLMAAGRRLVEADKYCRAGRYEGWGPMLFLGHDIHHKTLGIVGMGRIGQAVARRAHGFEMKILYTDEFRLPPEKEQELRATFVSLEQLLKESDFVSLHVPLMASTKHLVGKKQLEMMKKTAVLVNTSRGPVVDERALVEALKHQTIFAAGLDVYEEEPRLAPGLADLDNVTIPPHIASASIDTRAKMATMAASNIIAFFKGEKPPNIVNPEVLS
ncbi:MAG: D-glycerate dehydrogenase [Acidobacteria bacterium]|nr:MAG: D-glycerate dehydrogenase [Acidobacteriota bacterium]